MSDELDKVHTQLVGEIHAQIESSKRISKFGLAFLGALGVMVAMCVYAHAETFTLDCHPNHGAIYLVSYDTDARIAVITNSVSHHRATFTATDVYDNNQWKRLKVSLATSGQTMTARLVIYYSLQHPSYIHMHDKGYSERFWCYLTNKGGTK